jgi:asparagine synthase (glutamine-hydrolysing)
MCGISLISEENIKEKKKIQHLISKIKHRGPDDEGFFLEKDLEIGSCRLSIFDLSLNGHMPMEDKSKRYIISFNGEIYNFKELKEQFNIYTKSNSDTEVLIELYAKLGPKCLGYLNGIFAFIVYDKNKKIIFAARDRLGVKPIFYYNKGSSLVISSEIKGILNLGVKDIQNLNFENISTYLKTSFYDYGESTFYKNISQLKQGHYLTYKIDEKKIEFKKYWDLKNDNKKIQEKNLYQNFDSLLDNSFNLQTRTDTNIGANISSGIDSKLMIRSLKKYKEKKISYNSYYFDNKEFSEKDDLQLFAKEENINVNFFKITPNDIIENFEKVALSQDEPFPGVPTIAKHLLIKRAYDSKSKVILEAQGGDDIAGGYRYIFPHYIKNLFKNKNYFRALKESLLFIKNEKSSINQFYRMIKSSENSFYEGGVSADGSKSNMLNILENNLKYNNELNKNISTIDPNLSNLKKIIYRDIFFCKLPRILRSCDRSSMAHGKELRVPLLDHNIVEFFFNLDDNQIINNGHLRYFYRKFCEKKLGLKNVFQIKKYVSDPQTVWLKNDLFDWAHEIFSSSNFSCNSLIDQKKLILHFEIFKKNDKLNNSNFFWQIINLEKLFSRNK